MAALPPPEPELAFETPAERITVDVQSRNVRFFYVADHELTLLRWASPAVPLAFLGIALTAAVSFGIVLWTVPLSAEQKAVFAGLTWASSLVALLFLVFTVVAWVMGDQVNRAIRRRSPPAP